jgi:toxin ParE1/3/4
VPEPLAALTIVLAPAANRDIGEVLIWSRQVFGVRAAARYRNLLKQALRDIAADPERAGSKPRPELSTGVRTYHILFSRDRARSESGPVHKPRHLIVYRTRDRKTLEILRIL